MTDRLTASWTSWRTSQTASCRLSMRSPAKEILALLVCDSCHCIKCQSQSSQALPTAFSVLQACNSDVACSCEHLQPQKGAKSIAQWMEFHGMNEADELPWFWESRAMRSMLTLLHAPLSAVLLATFSIQRFCQLTSSLSANFFILLYLFFYICMPILYHFCLYENNNVNNKTMIAIKLIEALSEVWNRV